MSFSKSGSQIYANYSVYAAESPFAFFDDPQLSYWVSSRYTDFTPSEFEQVQNYSRLIPIDENQSELGKIELIMAFLSQRMDQLIGDPECCPFSSPVEVMVKSLTGATAVYCTHYATTYTLFANQFGIPTRMVHIRVVQDGGVLQHVVAESYIKSLHKWVMIDPFYGVIFARQSHDGTATHYLNTAEVLALFSNSEKGELPVSQDGSLSVYIKNQQFLLSELPKLQADQIIEQSQYFSSAKQTILLYENKGPKLWEYKQNSSLYQP